MSSPFLKLFGKSPFRPLFQHMETAYACTKELPDFFNAVLKEDWKAAEQIQTKINTLEEKADEFKRNLRLNLPKDLFLPVARTDLLDLIRHQDFLANETKHIAGLIMARHMLLPQNLQKPFLKFLYRCIDAAHQAYKAIRELNELYASGFSGKEADIIGEMVEQLHHIEHDTDDMQIELRGELFQHEADSSPIDVIFLYKILEWTGRLADFSQKIGDRLQICITR